jgi:gliding motility-associated-like protein
MKHSYYLLLLFFVAVFMSPGLFAQGNLQGSSSSTDFVHESEDFWASIDFVKLKNEIGQSLQISGAELNLFDQYLQSFIVDDRVYFFGDAPYGRILPADYTAYLEKMKQKYIGLYPTFLKVKAQFIARLAEGANRTLAANGPCTNIGFEDNTLNGWTPKTGTACGTGNCPLTVNTTPGCDIQVTNTSMVDPLVGAFIPPVFPGGGAHSVRIGNFQNGKGQESITQTFLVTNTNNVFTYNYAVVLEDPVKGHTDDQRPFFEVRMYDGNGNEITCATYKRFASAAQLPDFIHSPRSFPTGTDPSTGCSLSNNNGGNTSTGTMDIYYKPWSTVSIPLINYIGQNVTIVFTAGDCSLGAHLGYAYVDASCSMMNPLTGTTICGSQNVNFTATPGFESWSWQRLAPAPVTVVATTETVTINQPGNYSLTMQPFTNNNVVCPTVQNFTIVEHCPQAITVTLCENPKGTGTVTGVNLNTYNTQILNYNTTYAKTLVSWHSALPVSAANGVGTPAAATSLTVANGSKYYALINYNSPAIGSDTAVLNFIINPTPALTFPAVGPLCIGSGAVTLSATPAGGTYSGTGVSGTQFTPSTAGSFVITYSYTNSSGCPNTITQTIVVQAPPTVNAGPDQTICGSAATVALSGTATNTTSVLWTSNSTQGGTISPNNVSNVTYTPGANEKTNGATITMTLTANGAASCPSATDAMVLTIVPQSTINAGTDQTLCAPASFSLSGTSAHTTGVAWTIASGSNGGNISSAASANATYTTSAAERTNGATITLTFTGTAASPCPAVTDQVVLKIIPLATVNAGPDQTLCATSAALAGTATNYTSVSWSPASGVANPASLNTTYTPASPSTVTLTLTAVANAPCPNVTDQVSLTISSVATVNAGPDQTLCASTATSVSLSGTVTNATGGTTWTRNGVAIATNPNSLNTTYSPTAAELASGATITFTLTASAAVPCPAVSDQVIITIVPVATVNAGPDQLICASAGSFALTGTAANAAGGVKWTSNGTGTILTPNSLNVTYLPSASEKNSGATITMTLTATPASPCTPVQDQVVLTISPVATVNAGTDQLICATTTSVSLSGTATNAAGGVAWTSTGSGTISGANSLNATYTPSASELNSGAIITMTLAATPANPCPVVTDPMIITIIPVATVNAGIDHKICASDVIVSLQGTATHQTQVIWTGGQGVFSPANSLNTIYIPSSSELSSGATITVSLKATAVSPCLDITDQAVITIAPVATVNAGIDYSICASTTSVLLSGASSNAASVAWTTSGGGTLSSANTESTTYALSASEIVSGGSVTLTLTATANSPCPAISDEAVINIVPVPVAIAGPDQHVCEDKISVTLDGAVINSTGGIWSNGGGNYNPGDQTLNAVYTISAAEIRAGVATLVLTTVNNSICPAVNDVMQIFIHPLPVVDLGPDQKICPESDPPAIFNAGNAGAGTTWKWQPTGETTQIIAVSAAGTYTVLVTTVFGCSSSASANVIEVCPPRLFISNSFTPNADDKNDNYNVYGAHFTNFHMFIFNRWGEIIFESKDRSLVWDGIYRGDPMPIGVYPWIITYTGDSEEYYGPYRVEGSVTVVR